MINDKVCYSIIEPVISLGRLSQAGEWDVKTVAHNVVNHHLQQMVQLISLSLQSLASPWFAFSSPPQTYFSPPRTSWPCPWSCPSLYPWPGTRLMLQDGRLWCCPHGPADICSGCHVHNWVFLMGCAIGGYLGIIYLEYQPRPRCQKKCLIFIFTWPRLLYIMAWSWYPPEVWVPIFPYFAFRG